VSPAKVEALLRGYLNTWALYGLTISDAVFFDDAPDMRVDQYPMLRRFYRQEPARGSKAVRDLYDLIGEVTEVRRTMRNMDRTYRPEIATEMENTRENLLYDQMTRAQKTLRAINTEQSQVMFARSLAEIRELVEYRARVTSSPKFRFKRFPIERARRESWNDIGALKRLLLDNMVFERNGYAREVMRDVKGQK
jgi:hypothetical protein